MAKAKALNGVSAAGEYLRQAGEHIAAIRSAVPAITRIGEKMTRPLLNGGNLFIPSIAKFFPSEVGGRAGGMMGLRAWGYTPESKDDVGFFALPDPRFWKPEKDEKMRDLFASPATLVVDGREEELPAKMRSRIAAFTGGADVAEGAYRLKSFKPFTGFRAFEQFVRGWITQGELIGACTRAGKMPIMYMSVWLEGAFARNSSFVEHDNLREPWFTPLFHKRIYIPPLAPGYAAGEFLAALEKIHTRLAEQSSLLSRAGEWMAAAHRAKKKIHIVAVGHSYPEILELKSIKNYPINWGRSFSDLNKAVPESIGKGEVAIHLGYSPVDVADVKKIIDRGVKLIYTSPFGRPAALKDHDNLIWFDLPWRPADATIDIPGYSVRVCPMSSSTHAMVYNALLAEFADRMGWE